MNLNKSVNFYFYIFMDCWIINRYKLLFLSVSSSFNLSPFYLEKITPCWSKGFYSFSKPT